MTKQINKQKGTSSALIVIMMVVLIVFGLAIFTTSLSNLRLANKKHDWIKNYYSLEEKTMTTIAKIDNAVNKQASDTLSKQKILNLLSEIPRLENSELTVKKGNKQAIYHISFNSSDDGVERKKNIAVELIVNLNTHKTNIIKFEQWQEDHVFELMFD